MNRSGCLPKSVAHGGQIGQELLKLPGQARTGGEISAEDWQKLPSTPDGMVKLLLSQAVEKRLITALLETDGSFEKEKEYE